ncbi:MAG: GNAT family N-acetyltransferase [Bacillota bacterium]
MKEGKLKIRRMRPGEEKMVKSIVKEVFPVTAWLFFNHKPSTLVALKENEIVAGIVYGQFTYSKDISSGAIYWLFTSPEHQGEKIGRKLVSEAINKMKFGGCQEIFTCIEGYNSSASYLFSKQGFSKLSFFAQIKNFRINTLYLWYYTHHLFDLGHHLWYLEINGDNDRTENVTKKDKIKYRNIKLWLFNIIISSLIMLIAFLRIDLIDLSIYNKLIVIIGIGVTFSIRDLAGIIAGKGSGLKLEYNIWESGQIISIIMAVFTGAYIPVPGTFYPEGEDWSYQDKLSGLARQSLASSGALIVLGLILKFDFLERTKFIEVLLMAVTNMVIFDIALPFFPFISYNGRRIWDYNKIIWFILFVGLIGFIII